MTEHLKSQWRPLVVAAAMAILGAGTALAAENGGNPTILEARLILATDKPTGPPAARKLDTASMKRFFCFYKWTNFFMVKKRRFDVATRATRRVSMTDSCRIEVKDLGAGRIECKLFRDGKLLGTQTAKLTPSGRVIFGGHTSNDDAWFVSLRYPPPGTDSGSNQARAASNNPPVNSTGE